MALNINVADLPLRNHLSCSIIPHLYNRKQGRENNSIFIPTKPQGIWYGYYDSWLNWQSYNDPVEIDQNMYLYTLELKDNVLCSINDKNTKNKVLSLRESKKSNDYKIFYMRYATTLNEILGIDCIRDFGSFTQYIDWKAVSNDYAGIDTPNINSADRLSIIYGKISFLNTWDLKSGCIWYIDVVKFFSLVDIRKI